MAQRPAGRLMRAVQVSLRPKIPVGCDGRPTTGSGLRLQHFWTIGLAGVMSALPPVASAGSAAVANAGSAQVVPAAVVLPAALVRALTSAAKPEADAALRHRWRSALLGAAAGPAWDGECEQDNQNSGAAAGLARQRLPGGSWLLRLDCGAGAYQGSFWAAQVWQQAGQWRGAVLAWPVAQAAAEGSGQAFALTQAVVLWGDVVVQAGGKIEVLNRFRGLGDCGTRSLYQVRQGRTRFMVLAAVWACPDTPASVPTGPPDWPIVKSFSR